MELINEKNMLAAFRSLAISFIVLSLIGGVVNYSPVPFWDMWDGYLGFFTEVSAGNISVWWEQHNEHRIVLSRALFWIDLSWFQGMGWFLVVVNYILLSVVYMFFYMCLKEQLSSKTEKYSLHIFSLLILVILFSWIQKNNMTWGFQSQFILAQLLPLMAFVLLHKGYIKAGNQRVLFLFSCSVGVLSVGTMANGILTLPLMTLFALFLRMGVLRVTVLFSLAVLTVLFYFYGYNSPAGHGSLKDALLNNPLGLIQYVLLYIGSPFYYMTGKGSQFVGQLAGAVLIIGSVNYAIKSIKKPSTSSLQLAMLFFILYVGGTALGTAGGRLVFGIDQALSSRYQTPVLMAWAAFLVLYAPELAIRIKNNHTRVILVLMLIPLLLLPQQLKVFKSQQDKMFERWIAALALELGVKDQSQILNIFPSAEWALLIAKYPIDKNISVFGDPLLKNVNQHIGQASNKLTDIYCQGSMDEISSIEGVDQYVSVKGWIYQPETKKVPKLIYILNQEEKIIGYALTGKPRLDVKDAVGKSALESGFKGYMLSRQQGEHIVFRGYQPDCELKVELPKIAFSVKKGKFDESIISVHQTQIIFPNEWIGADFNKTTLDGYKIYGSFIDGDYNTGSISLKLKRNDSLFYRSGPSAQGQSIIIESKKYFSQNLPVATNWVVLSFTNPNLPDEFIINLRDTGADWGQWSAIGVIDGD